MTAQRIGISTIDFPDPTLINFENNNFETLNSSIAFQYPIYDNIQTLSTKGVDSDPYGILYVPDLTSDACKSQEEQHVPANATRVANLPAGKNYALIAIAPWFSSQCMLEYFAAARQQPTKAILVWQPAKGDARPPVLNDASWSLQDGGAWQRANTFPTYALTTTTGAIIVDQLSKYSGNLTSVPNGPELAKFLDPTDYVRLRATVSTDTGAQLPSLWVFLVIVLAVLIVAVGSTSIAMHIIQRRRRRDLQQRVLRGEVDLEALGVKRLNVSQQILDKLPLYTYTASPTQATHVDETELKATPVLDAPSVPAIVGPASSLNQPTCPICLDDFEPNETQVRELPCHHIFHPDCVDTFLLEHSSLCPMCKQSVLPAGACDVQITNMMVRRERHINRIRARGGNPANAPSSTEVESTNAPAGRFGSIRSRIAASIAGRHVFGNAVTTQPAQSTPSDIEMANNTAAPIPNSGLANPLPANQGSPVPPASSSAQDCTLPQNATQNRREWVHQRAIQMLGNRRAPASDAAEVESGPRWRRTLHKIFPR
ncbi:hypothetical protein DE146DRAFT_663532 [Phaeosphaeria sp. MPI-PUGE-AT-0046c]|nr:hypothetical protein DE146DRAFT_663532 [Phaeosphaeria sp. MPI-PUGE-AT-0046c]